MKKRILALFLSFVLAFSSVQVTSAEENNISEPEPIAEGGEEDPVQEDFLIENGVLLEYRGSEEHVTIPDGVTTLSYSAFQGNQTVVSVVIPNSVTEIQSYAFMDCPCLEEVTLPNNLQKTDSFVFDQSPKLKKVIFAEGTQEINVNQNFFYGCAVEEVVLPESVKKIGDYAFSEIAALKEINLPDSITEIGTEAFRK